MSNNGSLVSVSKWIVTCQTAHEVTWSQVYETVEDAVEAARKQMAMKGWRYCQCVQTFSRQKTAARE